MSETPEIPEGAGQRTSPIGLLVRLLEGVRRAAFPIVAVIFGTQSMDMGLAVALALGALIVLANLAFSYLAWRRLEYFIGQEDIRVESGVIAREARSVPFERIQDVSLEQSLLPRLFGLVQVKFETGAGGKDELALRYVSESEGERLREVVKERREEGPVASVDTATTHAEPTVEKQEGKPIFAMGPGRILTFGLFEFSLVIFGVLLGLAQQFEFLLPFDIWEWEEWANVAGSNAQVVEGIGLAGQAAGIVLASVTVALVGVATGIFRTFSREYGYRLDRTAKGFRRRRGLFTRTDVVMPVHRVQAARVSTGWLRRRFGWHSLKFDSLAQDSKSASHVVAPFAKLDEIWPIAREAGIEPPSEQQTWKRLMKRKFIDGGAIVAVIFGAVGIGWAISGRWEIGGLIVGLSFPLIVLISWLSWRRHRYDIDDRQIYVGEGILAPKLGIAQRVKLQSVDIRQGPIERWRGYAELHLGLPGGRLAIDGLSLSEARRLKDEIMTSIASVDFSELPR